MSEIKGQILGLLLVIGVFAAVATTIVRSFKSAANNAASNMSVSVPDGSFEGSALEIEVK